MNGDELKETFETKWGGFRRFIAVNPLTGFWIGAVGGFVVAALLFGR